MADMIETFARMWNDCDPNRGLSDSDEIMQFEGESRLNGEPRWKWFIPRAEASIQYLKDAGYKIEKSADD